MNFFRFISLLDTQGGNDAGTTPGNEGGWFIYVMLGLMAVWFVWSLISGKKKKKKEQEELNSLQPGDQSTTIAGITGKVVQVTEETVTFETGEDRVRLQVKKWAIQTNERAEAKAREAAEAKKNAKKAK